MFGTQRHIRYGELDSPLDSEKNCHARVYQHLQFGGSPTLRIPHTELSTIEAVLKSPYTFTVAIVYNSDLILCQAHICWFIFFIARYCNSFRSVSHQTQRTKTILLLALLRARIGCKINQQIISRVLTFRHKLVQQSQTHRVHLRLDTKQQPACEPPQTPGTSDKGSSGDGQSSRKHKFGCTARSQSAFECSCRRVHAVSLHSIASLCFISC